MFQLKREFTERRTLRRRRTPQKAARSGEVFSQEAFIRILCPVMDNVMDNQSHYFAEKRKL